MEERFISFNDSRDYTVVYQEQLRKHAEVIAAPSEETILFAEHDPIYTIGRRFHEEEKNESINGIPVVAIERGGGLTFHGPGQIVGYPIIHLEKRKMSIPTYLRLLEKTLQEVLKEELNLETTTRPEFLAGVWVGDQKLISIGIAVRHWVTFHGFALNVDCDLGPFRSVQPCGLRGDQITSLQELGFTVDREILRKKIGQKLLYTFFQ